MDPSQQDAQDQAAFSKQYDDEQAAQALKQEQAKQPPSFLQKWTAPVARVTTQMLDGAVSDAEMLYSQEARKVQDVAAGAMTGATNIADAAHSLGKATEQNFTDLANPKFQAGTGQPADVMNAPSPIWDHAKQHILDFRDAVAVKNPDLSDNLVQSVAQLALPFAGYSRALGGMGLLAKGAAAGAVTDATALGPHDMRMADLLALGRHTEGKLGQALRTLAPDGSALNAYINFLHDRTNETEAEGRFKNVLDGFGVNMIATPLLHGAAIALKQGTSALRGALEAGVQKFGDLVPPKAVASDASESAPIADRWDGTPPGWGPVSTEIRSEERALDEEPAAKQLQQTLLANAKTGTAVPAGELIEPLRKGLPDTPEGKFYSDILQRLSERNLKTPVTGFNSYYQNGFQVAPRTYRGQYRAPDITGTRPDGTVHIYPSALARPGDTVKTFTHELVHAATHTELENSRFVSKAIEALRTHGEQQFGDLGKAMYGFTNKHEFVAEIESNPGFQRAMRNTPMGDGRSVWEHYRDTMAGLLGVGGMTAGGLQMFDKLLSKENDGA